MVVSSWLHFHIQCHGRIIRQSLSVCVCVCVCVERERDRSRHTNDPCSAILWRSITSRIWSHEGLFHQQSYPINNKFLGYETTETTQYVLRDTDRISRVRFPAVAGNFSLHHRVKNGSGAHTASYPMGTRVSFPGSKVPGEWSWPLTSSSAEIKECVELYHHSHNTPSWYGAQFKEKAQGQLYL
jgi:hypothetical protein